MQCLIIGNSNVYFFLLSVPAQSLHALLEQHINKMSLIFLFYPPANHIHISEHSVEQHLEEGSEERINTLRYVNA